MITSLSEDVSAKQMVEEFEIELLDDYFERSRKIQRGQKQILGKEWKE